MNKEKAIPNTLAIISLMVTYFLVKELWGFLPAVLLGTIVYGIAYFVLVEYNNTFYKLIYGFLFLTSVVIGFINISSRQRDKSEFVLQGKYRTIDFSPETYLEIFNRDSAVMSIAPFEDTVRFTTIFSADSVKFYQGETERFRWRTNSSQKDIFSLILGNDSIHFRKIITPSSL